VAMTREPRWDVDKANGEQAERLWRKARTLMLGGAAEVKRDDRALETRNFYIEHACLRGGEWKPSGIRDPDLKATLWVIVAWPIAIALPTWVVRNLHDQAFARGDTAECQVGSHPTKGALIPVRELLLRAIAFVQDEDTKAA
jgi:hypothetical protein